MHGFMRSLVAAGMLLFSVASCAEDLNDVSADQILIVCYSHSGNTRMIADYIADEVGAQVREITLAKPYPQDFSQHLEVVREEARRGILPELAEAPDPAGYQVVFVGYPIWLETVASPAIAYLERYGFEGKTVIPFCTSGTSSAEPSYELVSELTQGARILDGLQIRRGTYATAQNAVRQWLGRLGFAIR